MAGLSGADAEELERLGQCMLQAADRLETIRGEIGAAFGRAQWQGEDAQHFHDLWQHRLAGQLQLAMAATREASATLTRNAREQRAASAPDSGGTRGSTLPNLGALGLVEPWDMFEAPAQWAGVVAGAGLAMRGVGQLARIERLTAAGNLFRKVGPVGDIFEAFHLANEFTSGDPQQIKAAGVDLVVDVGFKVAEAAALTCPPLAIGLGLAEVGWAFVPDEWKAEAVDGAIDVGHHVVEAAGDFVGDAGEAVGDLVEGGFNGVKHIFGW